MEGGMTRFHNKYGVPHHWYSLALADDTTIEMDVGCEEHWGDVQPCLPGDCEDWTTAVGWGNDVDGHVKIIAVSDCDSGEVLEPRKWARDCVWNYVSEYSG